MSNSKFKLTGENTNLARVVQMVLGPCTNVLRDVLRKEISPFNLEIKVRAYVADKKKPQINQQQETLVYGRDYSKFDMTLLYFLLRNMCSIQQHSNKWGNNPDFKDKSVSANIDRIRLIRNEYVHHSERFIIEADFNKKCKDIYDIVQDLEKYLGSSTKYQDEVKTLETCLMDPERSEENIKELLILYENINDISDEVQVIKKTVVPRNVKEMYETEISRWKEDDDVYVETHNFSLMLEQVKKQSYVIFVGVPGSGKTVTCRHIALRLQKEKGCGILPITDFNKLEDYCDPHNPQIFVIDDVLGVLGLDINAFKTLTRYESKITKPIMKYTKVLMTCREIVFKNKTISKSFLVKSDNVVLLHDRNNSLNKQDRCQILEKYHIATTIFTSANLASSSNMFPYLCKLFSTKKEYKVYGEKFFISPIPCILDDLDKMQISENKVQYASLVLLMAHQNKLSKEILENKDSTSSENNFNQMKCNLLSECEVEARTDSFKFIAALSEMEGTYTQKCGLEFTFIHDSMFEIVAFHFGRQFPKVILQCVNSDYIAHYIKLEEYNSRKSKKESESKIKQLNTVFDHRDKSAEQENVIDLCITLNESQYQFFAERLFKDVQNGEFFNVFRNKALKHTCFLRTFLDVMKSKSYTELCSLFLSEVTDTSKLPRCTDYKQRRLIHSRFQNRDVEFTYVKAIDLVIFYGHNQILQFIVDQMLKCTGDVSDLFQTPFHKSQRFNLQMNRDTNVTKVGTEGCDIVYKSDTDLKEKNHTSVKSYTESVIEEQRRLLFLSCLSNDIITVQIILKIVDTNALNIGSKGDCRNMYDYRLLTFACESGNVNIAVELLNAGSLADVEGEVYSPLIAATRNGHSDIVLELLERRADVNKKCEYLDETPLTNSCSCGDVRTVDILINAGADVNLGNCRNSPLETAIVKHDLKLVKFLIKRNADVNLEYGKFGLNGTRQSTPLAVACERGQLEIVNELLMHGADINKKARLDSFKIYQSPLQIACEKHYFDLAMVLLNQGADIKLDTEKELVLACRNGCYDDVVNLIQAGTDVNANEIAHLYDDDDLYEMINCVKWMSRPLIEACICGHLFIVDKLLESGAGVNLHNRYSSGTTPLFVACKNGHLGLVEKLLKNGANINSRSHSDSPLSAAIKMGHYDIVLALLKAEPDMLTSGVVDAIVIALSCGNEHIAEEMLKVTNMAYHATIHFPALRRAFRFGNLNLVKNINKRGSTNCIYTDNCSPLIIACDNGSSSVASELLTAGTDVNQKGDYETPLTAACRRGHTDVIETLLKYGANVNLHDKLGTPLTVACRHGHLSAVKMLIKAGSNVNQCVKYDSPLVASCSQGNMEIVQILLEAGADINQWVYFHTPLTAATECGNLNVVEVLIKKGLDINLQNRTETPLTTACAFGHLNIVKRFLELGVAANERKSVYSSLFSACANGNVSLGEELIKKGVYVNKENKHQTNLIVSRKEGHQCVADTLIKAGTDVICKKGCDSPLIAACKNGHLSIVKELVKSGADLNPANWFDSPLRVACTEGHLSIVKELIKSGADLNPANWFDSPLRASCIEGHLSIVKELIKSGADLNPADAIDFPLTAACSKGYLSIVKVLLNAGADVNVKCYFGSPLIVACKQGHVDVVLELIKADNDTNKNDGSRTPLIAACENGYTRIVTELIKAGADINLNVGENTPLTVAFDNGHMRLCKELIKAGADVNVKYTRATYF